MTGLRDAVLAFLASYAAALALIVIMNAVPVLWYVIPSVVFTSVTGLFLWKRRSA